jgi:hypothetical protein
MAGYIGKKAALTVGIAATVDELNILDGATTTTAEVNYNGGPLLVLLWQVRP